MIESTSQQAYPLCVDLDGTLIRTDLLYEQLVAVIKRNPLAVFALLISVLKGKAAFKTALAGHADGGLDIPNLPYDDEILSAIRRHRDQGRRIELISGSHEALVSQVAEHLGLFDAWLGTDGKRNLTGRAKARVLSERHPEGFAYIGNSAADLPVWHVAAEPLIAQAANEAPRLARKVDGLGVASTRPVSRWAGFVRGLRVHQWVKNGLVFLPLFLTLSSETSIDDFIACTVGFIAFCLLSSGTYFLNDILDVQADRRHPAKRSRAIASGAISIKSGAMIAIFLVTAGFAAGFTVSGEFAAVLGGYTALTLAYSFLFKRLIALDVLTIAVLFLLRAHSGSVAIDQHMTVWLAAFLLFFFLALAIGKRAIELKTLGDTSGNGRAYRAEDAMVMTAGGITLSVTSVMLFLIYAILGQHSLYHNDWAIVLTAGLLTYWVLRFWLLVHRERMDMDPVAFALRDPATLITLGAIAIIAIGEQIPRLEG